MKKEIIHNYNNCKQKKKFKNSSLNHIAEFLILVLVLCIKKLINKILDKKCERNAGKL